MAKQHAPTPQQNVPPHGGWVKSSRCISTGSHPPGGRVRSALSTSLAPVPFTLGVSGVLMCARTRIIPEVCTTAQNSCWHTAASVPSTPSPRTAHRACGCPAATGAPPTPGWRRPSPAWPGSAWSWRAGPSTAGAGGPPACRRVAPGVLLPLQHSAAPLFCLMFSSFYYALNPPIPCQVLFSVPMVFLPPLPHS